MKKIVLTLAVMAMGWAAFSQTFTLNSASPTSGTNFQSFTDLASHLNATTLTSPVVVNVASGSGPYTEQFHLGSIAGASSTNTVTINGNGETLQYDAGTNSGDRTTLELNNTQHITFNNLVVKGLGNTSTTEYGWAAHLRDGTANVIFDSCTFEVHDNASSDNYVGMACANTLSYDPTDYDPTSLHVVGDVTIKNSTFIGGSYGLTIVGGTSSMFYASGCTIESNTFIDNKKAAIYTDNCLSIYVDGNDISRPNRTNLNSFRGIHLNGVFDGEVKNNKIHNTHGGNINNSDLVYAIHSEGAHASDPSTFESFIYNNRIYNINGNGNQKGIYMSSNSEGFTITHNTIYLDKNSTANVDVAGIHVTGNPTYFEVTNNLIFLSHRSTSTDYYGLYYSSISGTNLVSDYNNVYIAERNGTRAYAKRSGSTYVNLSDWQAAMSGAYGQNSLDVNPMFIRPYSNLYPTNPKLDDACIYTFGNTDADGNPRSNPTDMGALEFTATADDAEDYSNNTAATADTVLAQQTIAGSLDGITDVNDYFILLPNDDGTLKIDMTLFSSGYGTDDFFAYVYNKNLSQIATWYKYNVSDTVVNDSIVISCRAKDTIYVRFYSTHYFTYQFNASSHIVGSNDVEDNNSFATAQPIGQNTYENGRIGYVGASTDNNDYFVGVPASYVGDVNVTLDYSPTDGTSTGDIFLYVYNKNLSQIGSHYEYNVGTSGSINIPIYCQDLDTIYLQVASSGCFTYAIKYDVEFTSPQNYEPNTSAAEAVEIPFADTLKSVIGYGNDVNDYFKTFVPDDGKLVINYKYFNTSNDANSDFHLYAYNRSLSLIGNKYNYNIPINTWVEDSLIIYCRASDSIYIRMNSSGCFKYEMKAKVIDNYTKDNAQNDNYQNAQFVPWGTLIEGGIGYSNVNTDINDYFKTVLPASGQLQYVFSYRNTSNSTTSDFHTYIYNKNLSLIGNKYNYNIPLDSTITDTLNIYCVKGDTIYVRHSSVGCFQYSGMLQMLKTAPADADGNDAFADAELVSVNSTIQGQIAHGVDANDYFKFYLPTNGDVDIDFSYVNTSNSTLSDIYFYFYNGAGSLLGQSNNLNQPIDTTLLDSLSFTGLAQDTFVVRVYGAGCFNYEIDIQTNVVNNGPANDNCENAFVLSPGNSCNFSQYTNAMATAQATAAPNPTCGFYKGADVWFKFEMPASGRIRLERQNGSTNIQLALYSGSCGNMTQLTCLQLDKDRTYHNINLAGDTLYVRAFSYNSTNGGTFDLCVWEPPLGPNDYCVDATVLTIDTVCNMASYTNQYATEDSVFSTPSPGCGFYKGGDVWFKFEMPASGRIRVERNNGTANAQFAIYSGTCGNMVVRECAQLDGARTYHNKYLAGQTLYLRVFSYNSEEGGTFDLCVWEPPAVPGDYCDNPIPLPVKYVCQPDTFSSKYATEDTTYSFPSPGCGFYKGGDVWFSLVMPNSGVLTIDRSNFSGNLQMALYSGTCGNMNVLTCAQLQSTINFVDTSLIGQTIYLRGFGYNSEEGAEFEICAYDPTCLTTIDSVQTSPASCSNANDGQLEIFSNCYNCSNNLEYSIDGGNIFQASNTFTNLSSGFYQLVVRDMIDTTCSAIQNGVWISENGTEVTYFEDSDNDGFGNPNVSIISCAGAPSGFVTNQTDCDDNDMNIWQDSTLYVDADGDGYDVGTQSVCIGNTAPTGYSFTTLGTDCDDTDPTKNIGETWYLDLDGDGYWTSTQFSCGSPGSGWTNNMPAGDSVDCDDNNINIWQDSTLYVDADGDGYDNGTSVECIGTALPAGFSWTTLGTDCDDNDNTVWQDSTLYVDNDGDGWDAGTGTVCIGSTAPIGYSFTTLGADCDDNNPSITAGQTWYLDADSDGWWVSTTFSCGSPGTGYTSVMPANGHGDCNDADMNVWQDSTLYVDADGDGYNNGTSVECIGTALPAGFSWTTLGADCDDNDNTVWQDSTLFVDNDGDGWDAGTAVVCIGATAPLGYRFTTSGPDCDDNNSSLTAGQTWYLDADSDGWWVSTTFSCGSPGTGYTSVMPANGQGDCNDADMNVWQDSTLFVDNDGDGWDAGTAVVCIGATAPLGYRFTTSGPDCDDNNSSLTAGQTWYLDADSDGWWVSTTFSCGSPGTGYTSVMPANGQGDCNDADMNVWQDTTLYVDADGDGYDKGTSVECIGTALPTGFSWTTLGADCDDNDNTVWQQTTAYIDSDGDGYDAGNATLCIGGNLPPGYSVTTNGADCDDNNASIYQQMLVYIDGDGDGYDAGTANICMGATLPVGYAYSSAGSDCNDADPNINPGATEICGNGIDEDCSGADLPCGGGCPPVGISFKAYGLNKLWSNQGANDPYTFYYGVVNAKRINAKVSGGVGPFTYSWSNSGAPSLKARSYYPDNAIDLFEPLAATYVIVQVTDQGTGCSYTDSVFIDWEDKYFCYKQGYSWYLRMCDNGNTVCVPWGTGKQMLKNGTGTLGACPPTKTGTAFRPLVVQIYPNPTHGTFSVEATNAKGDGTIEIYDLNGKKIAEDKAISKFGTLSKSYDFNHLPAGMYFVRVRSEKEIVSKKLILTH